MQNTTDWVNEEIRSLLARQRKTQQDLAAALDLSGASVTRRMAGDTPWALAELEIVAAYLGTTVRALVDVPVAS